MVSNVVYVIFAFILVGLAFMNIFGGEQNTWKIKTKLPKLIVGIVSVPFTWFLVSAIVSISSILTSSVLLLPGDILQGTKASEVTFNLPTECELELAPKKSADDKAGMKTSESSYKCPKSKNRTVGDMFVSENAYGILSVYAYGIFKIQNIKNIEKINLDTLDNIKKISVGLATSLIFFFVFLLLLLALCFALFSRAFMLWIYAIFSPLFSLAYFFEGKLPFGK